MRKEFLKTRMVERSLDNAAVAKFLGLRESTVRSYKRGSTPELPTCRALTQLLGCNLSDLLYPEELRAMGVAAQEAKVTA
jgi:DNA-binding XRE family transcriptional regulator